MSRCPGVPVSRCHGGVEMEVPFPQTDDLPEIHRPLPAARIATLYPRGLDDAGMGHDDVREAGLPVIGERGFGALVQPVYALAPVGPGVQEVGGPGVQLRPRDGCPGHAFPRAEVHLLETLVDDGKEGARGSDPIREAPAAAQRAGHQPFGGRQRGKDPRRFVLERGREIEIRHAVADAFGNRRTGVADQDQGHAAAARPPRRHPGIAAMTPRYIPSSLICWTPPRQSPV